MKFYSPYTFANNQTYSSFLGPSTGICQSSITVDSLMTRKSLLGKLVMRKDRRMVNKTVRSDLGQYYWQVTCFFPSFAPNSYCLFQTKPHLGSSRNMLYSAWSWSQSPSLAFLSSRLNFLLLLGVYFYSHLVTLNEHSSFQEGFGKPVELVSSILIFKKLNPYVIIFLALTWPSDPFKESKSKHSKPKKLFFNVAC